MEAIAYQQAALAAANQPAPHASTGETPSEPLRDDRGRFISPERVVEAADEAAHPQDPPDAHLEGTSSRCPATSPPVPPVTWRTPRERLAPEAERHAAPGGRPGERGRDLGALEARDVVCCHPAHACTFRLPAGFRIDLASIPKVLRAVVDKEDLALRGPILDGWLYRHGGVLPAFGFTPAHRWAAYLVVRAAGWAAWDGDAEVADA